MIKVYIRRCSYGSFSNYYICSHKTNCPENKIFFSFDNRFGDTWLIKDYNDVIEKGEWFKWVPMEPCNDIPWDKIRESICKQFYYYNKFEITPDCIKFIGLNKIK
jgi:hypothetical protein